MIRIELIAPNNEAVALMGSWNNWQSVPMTRMERGIWCTEVALADGDYEYKFDLISNSYFMKGQRVQIADPRATELTLDSRENAILRVRNGKRIVHNYAWQHDDKPLPQNDQLIIYEMHVRDFSGGAGDKDGKPGTFTSAIDKLDYLVDLGINAVELMPLYEFPWDYSWGYAAHSMFAIENTYGTPNELARFVDECHARGIRVIHDSVYNHMQSEAPITKIDYSYFFHEQNPDEPALQFGPKFNYEYFDEANQRWPARAEAMDAMHLWTDEFHMDGIRFDCTRAIKYFDLLSWFNTELHNDVNFKPFYTIAEHIPQDPAIAGPNGPMDAAWHENFYEQLRATVLGVDADGRQPFNTTELLRLLDGRTDGFISPINTVKYMDTHDHDRSMYALGEQAKTFDQAAFRRSRLGASLLLTAPGIPMLYMGQEFGETHPKSTDPHPLTWELLRNEGNGALFQHYKFLLALRKSNPALYGMNFQIVLDLPERGIIGYKRWNDQGNIVLVVANLKDTFAGEFTIADAGLEDGTWHEGVFNYDIQVQGGAFADQLAENEVKIYVKC